MATYEIARVERSGRRRALAPMVCRNDDEAIAKAVLVKPHGVVELRRGGALIWRFDR